MSTISLTTKYILLQVSTGPSLLCDVFVFAHFIRHWRKEIIKSPHNHTVLCLLIISFIQKVTDVPFLLHYLRWGISIQQTELLCMVWNWLDYTLISGLLHLLAWFSIERHLFIFHSAWMKTKWCLIVFHYIPLFICLVYAPCFYVVVIFFPTICVTTWDYTMMLCGGACYTYSNPLLGSLDWLIHYGVPTLLIFLANVLLLCRISWQKLKQGRIIDWRRQKWMIIQLLFISTLALVFEAPAVIVGVIQVLWSPTFAADLQYNYFYYICYFMHQFLPFVIIGSLPTLHGDLRRSFNRIKVHFHEQTRIYPATAATQT